MFPPWAESWRQCRDRLIGILGGWPKDEETVVAAVRLGTTEKRRRAAALPKPQSSRPEVQAQESSLRRMSLTAWGLAWPRVAFMSWPTKNLKTPSLPALNLATFAGSLAMISRAACSMAVSLT